MVDRTEFSTNGRNYLIIDMNFLEVEVKLQNLLFKFQSVIYYKKKYKIIL
jgi:hypothetical protein